MPRYSAKTIANAFWTKAESLSRRLTNMQLQKMVYFANGWNLALWDEPLVKEAVKAWTFGPVIPPLYNALKKYGNGDVIAKIDSLDEPLDPKTEGLIERVWTRYGHLSGSQMSAITHRNDSAWHCTYEREKFGVIDDKLIAEEFKNQMA